MFGELILNKVKSIVITAGREDLIITDNENVITIAEYDCRFRIKF